MFSQKKILNFDTKMDFSKVTRETWHDDNFFKSQVAGLKNRFHSCVKSDLLIQKTETFHASNQPLNDS